MFLLRQLGFLEKSAGVGIHDFHLYISWGSVLLAIIVHSTSENEDYLAGHLEQYGMDIPNVRYAVIFTRTPNTTETATFADKLVFPCSGGQKDLKTAVCRDSESYNYFLSKYPSAEFLYRATDDTFINLSNLLLLVHRLKQVIDPQRHLIFRATGNAEAVRSGLLNAKLINLSTKTGWLMSRAMVGALLSKGFTLREAYDLQCIGETDIGGLTLRVVDQVFDQIDDWYEPLFSDLAPSDPLLPNLRPSHENLKSIKQCGASESPIFTLNSLVSMHTDGQWNAAWFFRLIGQYSDVLYFYRRMSTPDIGICRSRPGIGNLGLNVKWLRMKTKRMTLDDAISRKRPMRCVIGYNL
jgi:hypothetical protein